MEAMLSSFSHIIIFGNCPMLHPYKKKGNKTLPINYRSISFTSVVGKLINLSTTDVKLIDLKLIGSVLFPFFLYGCNI